MARSESTELAERIFHNTRQKIDFNPEATVYEFPIGLRGQAFNLPGTSLQLESLHNIREKLRNKLAHQAGSNCRPMLVRIPKGKLPGVYLAQPHSFDHRSYSAAVIPMAHPNQAPVRVKIEELRPVC